MYDEEISINYKKEKEQNKNTLTTNIYYSVPVVHV